MNVNDVTLGWLVALIVGAVGLFKAVQYLLTPIFQYNAKQKEIDKRFEANELKLDNDNKRLTTLENDTKQILLSVNTLLQHSIDNNHTDELKKRKAEMDEYLIQR